MTIKTIQKPDGKTVRFGRRKPLARFKHLQLNRYLREPTPPASADYSPQAIASLSQMYDNDTLGNCVIAAVEHVEGVWSGNADQGKPLVFTDPQTIGNYSAACGYVQGNPNTDQGCDIQTVLQYWETTGLGQGGKLVGIMTVDPTNLVEVQTAVYLFENLIIGLDLPDAWVNPFPSANGFVWDVAGSPDPNNGHCVPVIGYNAGQVEISTWGMTGFITNAAFAKYVAPAVGGECYVVISQDILNAASQLSPLGLDWATLQADFNTINGVTPSPTPTPTPVPPTPVPPTPVPPTPVPPTPTPPGPTPTGLDPGSPAWLAANLSPEAWAEYLAAIAVAAANGGGGGGGFTPPFFPGGDPDDEPQRGPPGHHHGHQFNFNFPSGGPLSGLFGKGGPFGRR